MKHVSTAIWLGLGGAVLSGCGPAEEPPEEIRIEAASAAIVNGEPIYLTDLELEAAAQGLTTPGERFGIGHPDYQRVLDQLIDQRLLAQEAIARGLHLDDSSRRRLDAARERVLGNILVEHLVAIEVTDAAIEEMYAEQVALQQIDDEVRISHILLDSEETAAAARERVLAGEDFAAVAFELSLDTQTRIEGGALGYVSPVRLGEPFSSAIGNTEVGQVSEPFESEDGWHIIEVSDRRTPPPKTLEEMRPEIVTFLTYAQISQILKELRTEAVITPGSGVPRAQPAGEDDASSANEPDAPETTTEAGSAGEPL